MLPPVRARLDWRVSEAFASVKYALSPPEQAVFVPLERDLLATVELPPTSTPQPSPAVTPTFASPTEITAPTATTTPGPTPLPASAQLFGVRHEYQTWNNCGPATLSMALSFWGWQGDQAAVADFLKPNPRDKNVMPYEMAAFVDESTDLKAVLRVGGDIDLVKRFLAAGYPVILEKGFEGPDFSGWMGHYVLVTGYDDVRQAFTTQDSFRGPKIAVDYQVIRASWRAFNFTYLVVYPSEDELTVAAIFGEHMDEMTNFRSALDNASTEILTLTGRDQFFAWFNRGTNLDALQDYPGAAAAFDQAFSLYAAMSEEERPWRMMWYQTGPYAAYYYAGRYTDVINLATTTLEVMSEPVLEESYYWRARAREALGDVQGAIGDWEKSLEQHPGFGPSLVQLARLGQSTP